MIIAITGHRPEACESEKIVRLLFHNAFKQALKKGTIDSVIYGGAAGVDLWAADEWRQLDGTLTFAKPWTTHEPRKADAKLYALLEEYSSTVHVVTEADKYPGPWVYDKRNEWMVDNATHVLAYMNPETKKGGTFNCREYAKGKKPVRNIYNDPPF